jgi:aminoglycoside/choline kinase family phosphotransferase
MRELSTRFRLHEREEQFYREIGARSGVPLPRLHHAAHDPSGDAVLLIEDLFPARAGDLAAGCSLEQAAAIVDVLAHMHGTWWARPELEAMSWLPAPDQPSAVELMTEIAEEAWASFVRRAGTHLPEVARDIGERVMSAPSVLERLASAPRTLVHGDVRINNVMFDPDHAERVRAIIDWQTVSRARGPIDVASLFVTSLAPGDRRIAERDLLPRYHEALCARGVSGYTFEACWTDYRLSVLRQFSEAVVLASYLEREVAKDVSAATAARLFVALGELDLLPLLQDHLNAAVV